MIRLNSVKRDVDFDCLLKFFNSSYSNAVVSVDFIAGKSVCLHYMYLCVFFF